MRAAIAHRHAKPLRRAHGDIRAHRARLFEQAQRQKIGRDHGHGFRGMERLAFGGEVADMAIGARILEDRAEDLLGLQRLGRADDHLDAERLGAGLDHADGLRVAVLVDEEGTGLRFRHALRHRHGFRRRRRLIQKRRIGDRQPGQVRHHRLEVQKRLKTTLRDLGLVGRVGRVPGRVLEDIALDRGRRDRAVIALPDQAGHHAVLLRDAFHLLQEAIFGQRRPAQRLGLTDAFRHRLGDQRVEVRRPHGFEHLLHLGR